jgi:hypothetical protein
MDLASPLRPWFRRRFTWAPSDGFGNRRKETSARAAVYLLGRRRPARDRVSGVPRGAIAQRGSAHGVLPHVDATVEDAVEATRNGAGSQFDPPVEAFLASLDEILEIRSRYSAGERTGSKAQAVA